MTCESPEAADYNPKASIYWWIVALSGALVLLLAAVDVASSDRVVLGQILVGIALAALTGFFPVRIPGLKTSIAGGEIFIFLILLIHGVPAATLAAAVPRKMRRLNMVWTPR